MAIELFGDMVLIKPDAPETKTEGGIIIPDSAQKVNRNGTVVNVGEGAYDQNTGAFKPTVVRSGDRVIFAHDANYMESNEFEGLLLMSEKEILTAIRP